MEDKRSTPLCPYPPFLLEHEYHKELWVTVAIAVVLAVVVFTDIPVPNNTDMSFLCIQ